MDVFNKIMVVYKTLEIACGFSRTFNLKPNNDAKLAKNASYNTLFVQDMYEGFMNGVCFLGSAIKFYSQANL